MTDIAGRTSSARARRPAAAALLALALALPAAPPARAAVRIKDIAEVQGARSNQLVGFGLVVGLDNTGGRSAFTQQVAIDMLQRFEMGAVLAKLRPTDNPYKAGSVSAVMVTAELGPFARAGSRLDVTVSVMDDAASLQGGTLILTPLKGADGVDYAVAQGPIDVAGFYFSAPSGGGQPLATAQKNHPTVGRVPGGATVEREARGQIVCAGSVRLLLRDPDYLTARLVAEAINHKYPLTAVPLDPGTVQVAVPPALLPQVTQFVSELGMLEVQPGLPARVVINSRTGTVVAGEQVKISTVAVAHGNLAIITSTNLIPSQPGPFSNGRTTVVPRSTVGVEEQGGALQVLDQTTTVADLARAMNMLGATPRDMIAIFQALKVLGALHAELIIM